jgi:hypothetical protein
MAKDNQVLVRLNDPQFEAFKEFAEDRDYNHAEASREIIKSRLAGEGYLQNQHYDSPVTDGGLEQRFDETQQTLQNQSEKLDEQQSIQTGLNLVLTLSILWLGIHTVFSVASIVTVGTGIVLVSGLVYTYYQYWRN